MTTIALDCMGSDHGVRETVSGAALLSVERQDLQTVLVGDAEQISPVLDASSYDPARLSVCHVPLQVDQTDSPRVVLGDKADASIRVACRLVAEGRAQAVVTAGNTGAAILSAAEELGLIPGVRRAALAAVTPTERRHGPRDDPFALLLDVGATLEASARDLVTFAILGSAYATAVSENPRPRVALLSNGAEEHKGPQAVVAAHAILKGLESVDFAGNVEGLDIPKGTVDVVVTGGFLGNVVLKMLEGFGEVIADLASDAYARKFLWRLGLTMLSSGIKHIEAVMDWQSYGGAPILGFAQPVIKAHGRSRARAVANACRVAGKVARSDMAGHVAAALASLPPEGEEQP
jgi:phosphate acyltransferase